MLRWQKLISDFRYIMNKIGVVDPLPNVTNHMDYSTLNGPSIRLFNKIIKYLEEHKTVNQLQ